MNIAKNDFGMLAVCALRYNNQGRETYMPAHVRDIARRHLE